MPKYNAYAVVTINSIEIAAEIEADSAHEAEGILLQRIADGHFDGEIDARAEGRGFEIDGSGAEPA